MSTMMLIYNKLDTIMRDEDYNADMSSEVYHNKVTAGIHRRNVEVLCEVLDLLKTLEGSLAINPDE